MTRNRLFGLRIIKTGIAVVLCIAVETLLKADSPFYAVIACVMALEKSIDLSFNAGKNRVLGTMAGALTGLCFALVAPGNALLCGAGIIVTIYLCHRFHLNQSAVIACVVFATIMLNMKGQEPVAYSLYRIADTVVGIVVALAVNVALFPPDYYRQILKSAAELRELMEQNLKAACIHEKNLELKAITAAIEKLTAQIHLYVSEAKFLRRNDDQVFDILKRLTYARSMRAELGAIKNTGVFPPNPENQRRMEGLELAKGECLYGEDQEMTVVYNYHLNRLLLLYEKFSQTLTEENNKEGKS